MAKEERNQQKLNRTMGPLAAISIGVGTMVGAGIFVFPGIAGGQAGPAAMLSFLLGGLIALMVAVCTAELSTALPESGGGYFFISRSFGAFWGTLVGVAQWIGLVFASSFYLAGFGEYVLQLTHEFDLAGQNIPLIFSLVATALLLLINIIGTEKVGYFQNLIVISLTALLLIIFSYGLADVVGLIGEERVFDTFFPKGPEAVIPTGALVFTSYLGFVQISTVAGEITKPQKNLPFTLIGSVLIVLVLYIFVLFVCTSVLSVEELQEFGETATLEVARNLIGDWGAIIVLIAGLLSTLSSANASIMSSSRSVFALSKDQLIPQKAGTINERFGTPHIALLLVAIPIGVLLFKNNLQRFAEVASFLHLVIYAGICMSLLQLRKSRHLWYAPTFRVPLGRIIAIIGALCCIGLIFFMEKESIIYGLIIVGITAVYFLVFKRKAELSLPQPRHIDVSVRAPSVLLPIDVSKEGNTVPEAILKALRASRLLLLGYREIPEQTDPEQAREKNEEEFKRQLEALATKMQEKDITTKQSLVFTPNVAESIDRIIEEENCQAILTPRPTHSLNRLLIPIYELSQVNRRLSTIVRDIQESQRMDITIILMPKEKNEEAKYKPRINQQFSRVGLQVNYITDAEKSREKLLKTHAKDTDLVVLSESDSSDRKSFFNRIHKNLQKAVDSPVIVVLQEPES